jgi:hypothetical protein
MAQREIENRCGCKLLRDRCYRGLNEWIIDICQYGQMLKKTVIDVECGPAVYFVRRKCGDRSVSKGPYWQSAKQIYVGAALEQEISACKRESPKQMSALSKERNNGFSSDSAEA